MTFSGTFIMLWVIGIYGALKGVELPIHFNETYGATNLLLAFGIFGICYRLDKLIGKK